MKSVIRSWKKQGEEGVYVSASNFRLLKELVEYLTSPEVDIPVSALGVGPVSPGDIRKASKQLKPQVFAFEVKVTPEASQLAEALGVKIICGDSMEDMCQQFKEELGEDKEEAGSESDEQVIPSCVLKIFPNFVLNKQDPIVVGVSVVEGLVRVGTPLCIPLKEFIKIGRVAWIEKDQRPVEVAREGDTVIFKIVAAGAKTQQAMLGREFDVADVLISHIPRRSIYHFIVPR